MEIRASRTAKEGGRVCTDIFVSSARRRRRRKPIWLGRGTCQRHRSQSKSYDTPQEVNNKKTHIVRISDVE